MYKHRATERYLGDNVLNKRMSDQHDKMPEKQPYAKTRKRGNGMKQTNQIHQSKGLSHQAPFDTVLSELELRLGGG
jgi:hypothetical protein